MTGMKQLLGITFLLLVTLPNLSFCFSVGAKRMPREYETLTSIQSSRYSPSNEIRRDSQPVSSSHNTFHVSFSALRRNFVASLRPNHLVFAKNALVEIHQDGVLLDSRSPRQVAFVGEGRIDEEQALVHAVLVDEPNGVWHMRIWNEVTNEGYVVEPAYLHPSSVNKRGEDKMIVYKESTKDFRSTITEHGEGEEETDFMLPRDESSISCGNPDGIVGDGRGRTVNTRQHSSQKRGNCPLLPASTLYMGVAADAQYTNLAGGEEQAFNTIAFNWNLMAAAYQQAVNVTPRIQRLVIQSTNSYDPTWNAATCPPIHNKLLEFGRWQVQQTDTSIGLWHLLSGCYPGVEGKAGRGWVGVLCYNGSTVDGVTSSAVSGFMTGNAGWLVPAHEVGHNFGAEHSVQIMGPSVNIYATYFAPISIEQFCNLTLGSSPKSSFGSSSCLVPTPLATTAAKGEEGEETTLESESYSSSSASSPSSSTKRDVDIISLEGEEGNEGDDVSSASKPTLPAIAMAIAATLGRCR